MKILHIAEFGIRKNGIGTVVERLYNEQIKLGHDIKIATTNPNLAYQHLPLINAKHTEDIASLLKDWKPDAVLFHSIWCMSFLKIAKLLKKNRIPYAVMMHGANSTENYKKNTFKKWLANSLFFNKFMKDAAIIIYLSQKEYENCVSKSVNPNYVIIPNGCDMVDFDVKTKSTNQPLRIIYLGRLVIHHKGLDILFDALDILHKKGFKETVFQFYGNENDVDIDLVKERLKKLEGLASYEGPAYNEKKKKVLENADAFILTSRYEGMPMGVLEALTYGVPCILTPGTNMSEDLAKAGAGWETDLHAESIAKTIVSAVADLNKDYSKYHISAYELSKHYDWKTIAEQYIDFFKSMRI